MYRLSPLCGSINVRFVAMISPTRCMKLHVSFQVAAEVRDIVGGADELDKLRVSEPYLLRIEDALARE